MLKTKNEDLILKIVEIELKMFSEVDGAKHLNAGNIPMYRKLRQAHYSVLSDDTLEVWLKDLSKAYKNGRNIILEKEEMVTGKGEIRELESMAEKSQLNGEASNLKPEMEVIKKRKIISREKIVEAEIEKVSAEYEVRAIVEQENKWQDEVNLKYPLAVKRKCAPEENFKKSLYCELHTWSKESINSYFEDICLAKERKINLTEKRFNNFYKSIGQGSLNDAEEKLRKKRNKSRIIK